MKRSLAIVLSVLMVLSCCTALLSFAAFADAPTFDWATVWFSPDENGTWQSNATVPANELFDYDYTAAIVGSDLKIGVVIKDVTLSGTDASYGNGNGTNFRVWLRAPEGSFDSYNYFFDISKKTSSWDAQMKYNKSTDGNSGGTVFAYGETLTGFSYDVAVLDGNDGKNNVALDVTFPLSLFTTATATGETYCANTPNAVDVVVSVSNKAVTNYCLHSNNNTGSPVSKAVFDANGKLVAVAGNAYIDGFSAGEPIVIDSAENSCYPNGQIPSDNDYYKFTYNVYDGKLYIDLSLHTVLATKDATSFGNGNGSNIRLWLYDPAKSATEAFDSYNYFLDVEYHADGTFTDRLMYNQKGTKANNAAALYVRDAANKPYTVVNTVNTAAEDGYTWNAKIILPLDVIATAPDYEFQFQPNIGFYGEHPNDPAKVETGGATVVGFSSRTYGHTVDPYNAWAKDSAIPYDGQPGYFTDVAVPTEGSIITENVALGKTATAQGLYGDNYKEAYVPTDGKKYESGYTKGYWNGLSTLSNRNPLGDAFITVDLGEEYDNISAVSVWLWPAFASGIAAPSEMTVWASIDGEAWFEAGEYDLSMFEGVVEKNPADGQRVAEAADKAARDMVMNFDNFLDARYIKIDAVGGWTFIGEIEVETTELAEQIYINDINSYNWGVEEDARKYAPILAFGSGNTAAQIIGGEWFGWWTYVKATWNAEAGAFIVNSLHLASDGQGSEYKTEVLGPYDIVLLTSTAEGAEYSANISHYIWDNVKLGDKLYLYGLNTLAGSVKGQCTITDSGIYSPFTVTVKAPILGEDYLHIVADPAGFTDVDVPAIAKITNVALGCNFTDDFVNSATYYASLVDGVAKEAPGLAYNNTDPWKAYTRGTLSTVFDLGEKHEDIGSIRLLTYPFNGAGIVPASKVQYFASNNGFDWEPVATITTTEEPRLVANAHDNPFWIETKFDKLLEAQYIKMSVTTDGTFSFMGEIEINAYESIPAAHITNSYAYTTDDAILATWLMGDTLNDVNSAKAHQYWNFASAAWDSAEGAFVVNEVVIGDGAAADFRSLEIPDYGFIIGAHQTGASKDTAAFIASLEVGDKLYVQNVDIANVTKTGIALDGYVATEPLEGYFKFADDLAILTAVGYAGGDATIWVPYNGKFTPKEIRFEICQEFQDTERTIPKLRDYNYYKIMVVDANGIVVDKALTLGDTTNGDIVIPEGGYAIGAHGDNSSVCAAITAANIGDTVALIGVDLADIAGKSEALTGASFFTFHTHVYVDNVVPATCTVDGYTEHVCICGDELEHTDIVTATGVHNIPDGTEVVNVPSTCTEHGYSYQICPVCHEQVVVADSELPLAPHDYDETKYAFHNKYVCPDCGDFKYTDPSGETEAQLLIVSHKNAYNWDTFDAMILNGDGRNYDDFNVNITTLTAFNVYLVENVNGEYVATKYFAKGYKADDDADSITLSNGAFFVAFCASNRCYNMAKDGALLNYVFIDHDCNVDSTAGFSNDTNKNPNVYRSLYVLPVPAADYTQYNAAVALTTGLVETDYTAESWAILEAALAEDVSGLTAADQDKVNAAASAIIAAYNGLVEAKVDVVYGDFDGDEEFTSDDLILACQLFAGTLEETAGNVAALDVDGDSEFTSDDLIYMCKYFAGTIEIWPAEIAD